MSRAIFQSTVVSDNGDIQPSAQIDVIDEATGVTPTDGIWGARSGGAQLSNPFFADSNGFFFFYAEPGRYRVTASGGAGSQTWRNVEIVSLDSVAEDFGDTIQNGAIAYSSDTYTFTPLSGEFRALQAGMVISFPLPATANTTTSPDLNYNGTVINLKYIDGSSFDVGDLDDTYNKQNLNWRYDGTDFLLISDLSGEDWLRRASGFQECSGQLNSMPASGWTNATTHAYVNAGSLTFPKPFSTCISVSGTTQESQISGRSAYITTLSFDNSGINSTWYASPDAATTYGGSSNATYTATGRWY